MPAFIRMIIEERLNMNFGRLIYAAND